ncbi:plasmid maintenance system antidote protein, XRE family [Desulfatibacillum aliphaticivorans]|uniref:Plasmid maintenance system antidote protein, XRE family n=1 Tax=Desulfatibacillum aliphaticivorans TaxID=218208 RepID=B8FAJ9_DESAL|nr:helix-turn-helix transcriptional regulator [Desulfatibacillum aliphaticivorans]ACL03295.1 plasmid maintenance system antidote protein, XRE family [Desulfatibacillum aliphaticivorans]
MKAYGWFKEELEKVQDSLEFKLESLELEITEQFLDAMEKKQISRAELARRMGVKKPTVTRLFKNGSNLTLKRMLSIAEALDCHFQVKIKDNSKVKRYGKFELLPSNRHSLNYDMDAKVHRGGKKIPADDYYYPVSMEDIKDAVISSCERKSAAY